MVINPNSAGVAASNNLSSNSSNAAKASRQATVTADDVTLSPRTPEKALSIEVPEISDAEGAWKASDFARNYILASSHSALLVQGNVNPQSVLDLLAE